MFRMKTLFSLLVVALVTTVFVAPPVEAKRLGGGINFGKSYKYSRPAQKKVAPAPTQRNAAQQNSVNKTAAAGGNSGRGGMMGMLGGLAAGGLLAALFFGGAFENINFFDILLLGGLAFAGIALFRAMRGGAASAAAPQPAAAGAGAPQAPPMPRPADTGFEVPEIGAALKGEPLSVQPEWFDERAFMAEAANHFMTLQQAWDSGDMSLIREYTTPEFFEVLSRERAKIPGQTRTQIMNLHPQLLDLLQDGDKVVAAILFNGYEQEGGNMPEAFADVWHVEHPADDPNADWLLAGIRKMEYS